MSQQKYVIRRKDKTAAIVLCLFLGGIGIHKFYLDRPGLGVIYFLFAWTLIPAFLAFLEVFVLLSTSQEKFDQEYNGQ